MKRCRRPLVRRVASTLPLLATLGLTAVACAQGELPIRQPISAVRRIFVPAESPASWPVGNWQPIPLAELEQLLDGARSTIADPGAASIEQAYYEATLSGENWKQGTFIWNIRPAADSTSQPPSSSNAILLDPLNLPLFDLRWDVATGSAPATWGTDALGRSLLICDERQSRLTGAWGLRGRRLARSIDFEFSLPAATVTRMVLRVPIGVVLATNCGDISGPHADRAADLTAWRLNLGGHTRCRVRATPAVASLSERPLLIASERMSYVVRPELVRWQIEFEPQVLESEMRKFVVALDSGMQLTSVDYGEDGLVAWSQHQLGAQDVVEIQLPEAVRGLGQRLLARGFAAVPASGAWRLPRARLMHAVSTGSEAVLRLQDPYRAADIRPDGYRQVEFTVDATDEETLTFRQFRPDASISLEPDRSLSRLTCRTVATVRQGAHGWSFDAELDLQAASGGCFTASCRLPALWSVTDVRPALDEFSDEALRWDVQNRQGDSQTLSIDFVNALNPAAPRRVNIQAFCGPGDGREGLATPLLAFGEQVDHEMTLFIAGPPGQRAVLEQPRQCRMLGLKEISPEIRNVESVRSLLQASSPRVLAIRGSGPESSARVVWHDARAIMPVKEFDGTRAVEPPHATREIDDSHASDQPVVPLALRAAVRLTADSGYDRYVVDVELSRHDGEASLAWSLDEGCELLQVRVDGQPQSAIVDGNRQRVTLAAPSTAPSAMGAPRGRLPVVEIEYRALHPAVGQFGGRPLHLPQFDYPPLHFDLRLFAPASLNLKAACAGISLARMGTDGTSVDTAQTPVSDVRVFNPFNASDWRRLAGFFRHTAAAEAATGAGAPGNGAEFLAGESPQRLLPNAPAMPAGSNLWHASGAILPAAIELELTDATTRRARGWSVCALACLAIVVARGRRLRKLQFALAEGLYPKTVSGSLERSVSKRLSRLLRVPDTFFGQILAVAIATTGFVAIAWDGWPGDLAASALAGAIVGMLLPTRWLMPRLMQHSASTHPGSAPALSSALAGGVLIAALPVLALEAAGQQPADSERRLPQATLVTPPQNAAFDILVPVDRAGKPAEARVVYIHEEDLAQLRGQSQHAREPAYVVRSARFVGRISESRQLTVSIAYEVTVLSEIALANAPVLVEFPGRGLVLAGHNPCLVDGRPSRVARSSNGEGVVVELPAGYQPQRDAGLRSSARQAAISQSQQVAGRDRHRTYRVEFEAQALVEEADPGVFTATIGALPVYDAVATLADAPAGVIAPVSGSQADFPVPSPEAADRVWVRLSHASAVQFRWDAVREPLVTSATEVSATATALVDLGSDSTRLSWRVDYQVMAGRLEALHWKLPAGWSVQSLYSSRMAGYTLEPGDAESRRIVVELAEPNAKSLSIEASFVRPAQAGSAAPLLLPEIAAPPGGGVRVTLADNRIGFRHSPQYRLDVTAADTAQSLRPCSVDDFAADWYADGSRPQLAFDLARPGNLRLAFESLSGTLLAKCESRVRCSLDQLDWAFLAEIDRPQVPRFQFRLRVDPRLRVRHVSVLEDGAERLWRWSHTADSLVVFLTDRITRAVTLRVDAYLPLAVPGDVALPYVQLDAVHSDGAEPAGEMLFLESSSDTTVRLVDAAGRSAAEFFSDAPNSEALAPGAVRLSPELSHLHLRVTAVLPGMAVEAFTCFVDGPAGSQARTMVEYDTSGAASTSFELQLPARLYDRSLFVAPQPAEVIKSSRSDGAVVLTFYPLEPVAERFRIFVVTPADGDSSGTRTFPDFDIPGGAVVRRDLLLPPGATATTSAGEALVNKTGRLPNWLVNWPTLAPGFDEGSLVELPPNTRLLKIRPTAENRRQTEISLVGVTVEVAADGSFAGRLLACLPESLGTEFEFAWPSSAQPHAAFVDGYSIGTPAIDNDVWTPALPATALPRLLSIAWTSPPASLATLGHRLQQSCPWPARTPVDETFLTLQFPADLWCWPAAPSRTTATQLATAAEKIAALQNRLTTWHTDRREDESASAQAPFEQFALAFLAVDQQQPPARPTTVYRLSNYDPHDQPQAAVAPGLLLPKSYLRYTLALLAIALMLAVGGRLAGYVVWLQEHRAASLCALGLAWWLLLSPSVLGLAIVFCAAVDAWLVRRRKHVAPIAGAT